MKASKLILELAHIVGQHGDIEVQLQNTPEKTEPITSNENFFVVPEEYPEDGWRINLREWPY